ncbi:MAG TPA: dihydroorotate dehydrogenase (quinone) [Algoriphagus sp.]|uniref:quinone-dependent dihydroorotate dehydrogenase n=1 Tax=unclassified Algoriphagus TaxID=2641541 RepID=UPI000C3B2AAF|nr:MULTISPECIES: quinone-dependent dihydroorotate dehydrogenase [unclassified Algoriphagus]MAL12281.1 dihydroorotate dehydrogenase (quinone) [Algoriphagus sp.]MAN88566.1 dihydroorotate dehydrogenase (quinone) [Algoriphagus sp.]HCB47087.1 dihydroorotate dehydrogenase (quinone) [Algoriphagus sp.]HCD87971.1 dihydroorotate dehydrogenase (quinone) [Algoriphagus sp.]
MYKSLLKPLLFLKKPEAAHHLTFDLTKLTFNLPIVKSALKANFRLDDPLLEREVFGLKFKNPVGLAAGFDKDAKLIDEMAMLGFGFIEIGTLTPKPQEGNPQPRLFRLPQDEALINRMGFNNGGVLEAVERLKKRKSDVIVGGNIGKNKVTPNENAVDDYLYCLEALHPYVDYFVVNVSSPNTPNLRDLQEKEPLKALLSAVKSANDKKEKPKPILLKIAPDLTDGQLDDIIEIVLETEIDGVIATNTTIDRSALKTDKNQVEAIGAGGVSGKVLKNRSTEVIRYLNQKSIGAFPIIGVGGIYSAEDAIEKLQAGASLVQVYSGMIYEGPSLIKRIKKGLLAYFSR